MEFSLYLFPLLFLYGSCLASSIPKRIAPAELSNTTWGVEHMTLPASPSTSSTWAEERMTQPAPSSHHSSPSTLSISSQGLYKSTLHRQLSNIIQLVILQAYFPGLHLVAISNSQHLRQYDNIRKKSILSNKMLLKRWDTNLVPRPRLNHRHCSDCPCDPTTTASSSAPAKRTSTMISRRVLHINQSIPREMLISLSARSDMYACVQHPLRSP
jgi:hypothetical protein